MRRFRPLDWEFLDNSLRAWIVAAVVLVVVIGTLHLLKRFIVRRYGSRASTTANRVDDALVEMLRRTRFFFILFTALGIAVRVLALGGVEKRIGQVATAALLVQFGIWGMALVGFWSAQYVEGGKHADPGSITAVTALGYVAKAVLWLLVGLLVLANFNINVTALVAGLGVTGIAVALAVQSVLGDLLGALNIVMAKPFVVGESITMGDVSGTVEYVGLRTTRLRSASGEQVTVPNKQLLENTVRNYSRMAERRVVLVLGVVYETPPDVLARLPQEMRTAVESHGDRVRFDRAHLRGIGSGSVDFELVYWIRSPDYGLFADTQQAVVLDILRRFEAAGALLAYPAQRAIPFDGRFAQAARPAATA